MGKPLFKAPDGGYYEKVGAMEDNTQSQLQQEPEISVLVEQKVRPVPFRVACPCPLVENCCNIWVDKCRE